MLDPLYLDTARLGQMSPRACRASVDFARFASEQGCSLYFSKFLSAGASVWPESFNHRYPGLSDWEGISGLSSRLKQLAGASPESDVIIAARSAALMRFAARVMIGPCRNVLLTDLTWPAYEQIFSEERRGAACRQTRVALRKRILEDRISAQEVIEILVAAACEQNCDGLFLPLVDNLGVQLPVAQIVQRLRSETQLRFVVIDGAQSLGHVPLGLAEGYCDLLLAGCHKWLRAFSPLGLAFSANPGSQSYIQAALSRGIASGEIDDPLLSFSCELQSGQAKAYGETVQVSPLFTAHAATLDALDRGLRQPAAIARTGIIDAAEANGWRHISPEPGMQSRIMLFEPHALQNGQWQAEGIREHFLKQGISVTAYEEGRLRISLPDEPLSEGELDRLAQAFWRTAQGVGGAQKLLRRLA